MGFKPFSRTRQRGVAVVTALLLTTLAVTIVASLFWQQQVQVRSIENQRLQLQKQWILRGALDWARLILRENARLSPQYDSLDQPWAVPLQETRLDQYVENNHTDAEAGDATLSGQMVDAQSMVNLNNLAANGVPVEKAVKIFARLLGNLRLNPSLAQDAAVMIAASTARQNPGGTAVNPPAQKIDPTTGLPLAQSGNDGSSQMQAPPVVVPSGPPMLAMTQVEDLLAVPGFTPEAVEKLRNLVIFLPASDSKVNINTAPAEVLTAVMEDGSASDAAFIIAARTTASFRQSDSRLSQIKTFTTGNFDFRSNYFLVNGKVKLNRAALQIQALISRSTGNPTKTQVIWTREN
ncbi:MAG: ral secretion pathway protein GspK [Burkholderia sp.]|jgi:general secretion pathway protein K|nr:ral secretion pathway protein GspK [Burkholderia sp.]